ncbi:hypothetical protein TTHERM_00264850 (macronuclear) [Tetrahymena thermophila SB210]|uniref:Cilia-and flagella-associated protein 96 n=1 Tax=Tetrahymena thermophila (strain SB210) TaxID=312017 RepID=Q22TZ7_TETTS|nr:hypothetical protein TTHERM_00264850 [Tetrahymena thermophila SB210]EAR88890.2 hypothetical protein TTHERM_00264850 [Tetrahymena thermophila SB210]|eukprot:XP_001009135.2 hypothetical protein TTHERM_00264850 [Tetrahymena thermophila SB210]
MTTRSTYQAAFSQGGQNQHNLHTQPDYCQDQYGQCLLQPSLYGTNKSGRPSSTGGPRNIYTNPKLQRMVEPSLFQVPSSILQGDPYKDPYRTKQITDQQRVASIPHVQPFKPTDVKKTMVGGLYEHMKDFDDKTYRTRDEYGTIITGPKNFLTNPNKRGLGNTTVGHLFNPVTYSNDPFHRAKEMDVQERLEHKSRVLDLKKPFCSTQHGRGIFNSNRITYGLDRNVLEGRKRSYNYPPAYHPKCFKNADKPKQGYNKTFSQFPEYIAEGDLPEPSQKKTKPSITQGNWRPNSTGTFSRPTPNITSLLLNKNKMSAFRV